MQTPFKLGFRGRLIAAMVGLVVLVSLSIGALFMAYLFEEERTRAIAQLDIAERLTREVVQRRTALELSRLSVLVQDFGFRSAVASGDNATIRSALENHSRRIGAEFALVLGQSRQVLASTLDSPAPEIPDAMFRAAAIQGHERQLLTLNQAGYELLLVPVQAPGLRAWMAAGFLLDQEMADVIARLSGTDVLFQARGGESGEPQVFASTTTLPEERPQMLAGPVNQSEVLDNPQFFSRTLPLASNHADLEAVLLISREESLHRYFQRVIEITFLVLAIVLLATALALFLARSLGKPVRQLADYARAVGNEPPPVAPDIRTGGEIAQLSQAFTDMVSRLKEREEHIRHAATHDDVTGLGNRNALIQSSRQLFQERHPCCVIGIRLEELSEINDTLGLELGDKVLIGTANRLRDYLNKATLLARTGGDEFLAILPAMSPAALKRQAEALSEHLQAPLPVDNTPFSLRITLVTMSLPDDATDPNQFRRRLNLTFEKASDSGTAVTRYQPGEDENHLRELRLISDLHTAITEGGLTMNYQPKLDFRTGKLVQVEALVRWIHPDLGFISPEEFIFLAERSGQIHDLTGHILKLVAQDARAWQAQGLDIGVAINLSAMDLAWPGLTDHIARNFTDWPGGMSRITFEVTESAVMDDPDKALATLNQIRDLGATLSVDDFGTGYSSLSQLRNMPVQELKIDKSFVLNLASEPQDQLIVRSTIDMAHGLGLKVVAEGIETMEAWALLQAWTCDLGQGFGLSRPVPLRDLLGTARALAQREPELAATHTETSYD